MSCLDHTWFRKHENRSGRWTSPDPYNGSISLGNPQSLSDTQSRLSAAIAASEVGFGGGPENLRFSANRQAEPGVTPLLRTGFCKVGLKGTVKYSY